MERTLVQVVILLMIVADDFTVHLGQVVLTLAHFGSWTETLERAFQEVILFYIFLKDSTCIQLVSLGIMSRDGLSNQK
jgi:hypothetical protein